MLIYLILILNIYFIQINSINPPFGKLKVENGHLLGENEQIVQLRGMSLFHSQCDVGYPFYNEETIEALKCSWHVNIVRACLGVMNYGQKGYLFAADKKNETEKVKTVVDASIKLGIYVLVDFHYTGSELYINEAKEFFKEMSSEYKGIPNVLYEILNEAVHIPWPKLKEYHETIIPIIRENDPDAIIICGTPEYDQQVLDAYNDPITNFNNIMYTLHFYSAEQCELLRSNVEKVLEKNFPLFVTEHGLSLGSGGGPLNKQEMNIWWQMLDKYKISYINWSISNKNESSTALIPGSTSKDVGKDTCLSESGKYVKQMLLNKQPLPIGC